MNTYPRFLALSIVTVAALLVLGYLPTRRLAGEAAIPAMLVGCGLGLVAALVGTLPAFWARRWSPKDSVSAVMGATALRLTAVVVLVVAAVLSGLFDPVPLVLWTVLSHIALLLPDTLFARAQLRMAMESDQGN